ncbi:hypothetical protein [Tardiphaga sp. vice154]|uniref:hypothetical protein n=1 Tax=Tardiphaga sp. vice154 TaxID=2592814 RepID=UPI00143CC13E|nr:hypothetical protein [Tardiphaga sp. vice154]
MSINIPRLDGEFNIFGIAEFWTDLVDSGSKHPAQAGHRDTVLCMKDYSTTERNLI